MFEILQKHFDLKSLFLDDSIGFGRRSECGSGDQMTASKPTFSQHYSPREGFLAII